jgi:hypothetical protein
LADMRFYYFWVVLKEYSSFQNNKTDQIHLEFKQFVWKRCSYLILNNFWFSESPTSKIVSIPR